MVHELYLLPCLQGDLPLFTVRPYSQDPAEDYCPTVLPDFLDKTYFTPFEAFVVLIIVSNLAAACILERGGTSWHPGSVAARHFPFLLLQVLNHLGVLVTPEFGWEAKLFSTVFRMRGRKVKKMKQPFLIHFEPLSGVHRLSW